MEISVQNQTDNKDDIYLKHILIIPGGDVIASVGEC